MPAFTHQDRKVWQKAFQELIQEVKPSDQWSLTLDESLAPSALQPGWTQYQQWVFARFNCSWCSRSWASAKVRVLFHMHWSKRDYEGRVKMRIFGQRCNKCSPDSFEVPEFTEENISRILNNLVFRILKKCYKEGFKSMEEIPTVQDISLEGPHDSDNCEACLQGFCTKSGSELVKPSPVSPSLPTISSPTFGVPIYKPSPLSSSTVVKAVTGNSRVKEGKVPPNPWFSKPPQAENPRVNTNDRVKTIIQVPSPRGSMGSHTARDRTDTIIQVPSPWGSVGSRTARDRTDTIIQVPSPWGSMGSRTARDRTDTIIQVPSPWGSMGSRTARDRTDTIIQVPSPRQSVGSHTARDRWRCNPKICCCLVVLILIIAVVVVVVKTIT
ncbi:receptor-transporting protein 3 isoform X1 [Saccopteryx leptura]|uniref:receptor-transporting protein 3 isoform X1 n=2 Tax=Saccopteryx leptura TaxID=249018 RepID=UPI00339BFB55